ncbi:MAG: FecR domain-containing protein [Candidatus Methylacidiphilales bacterium]
MKPSSAIAAEGGLAVYRGEETFTAYLESDVRKLEPNPVVLRPGQYLQSGGVYLVDAAAALGRPHVYLELIVDWIEPIALTASKDTVRVASLIGTAEARLPGAASATPLALDQEIPVGSTIQVGPEGCVGLDVGGSHAICLIPGTLATIQRQFQNQTDQIEVRLQSGAVFSHVNMSNSPTDYKVITPRGIAAARGTDFVTVALPDVTDVWIQEGTVELLQPDGTSVGIVSSDQGGSPKILRFPPAPDEAATIRANSATFTVAATLIPRLNQNLARIRGKQAQGETLTSEETNILNRAQRMHALIKVVAVR